MTVTALVTSAVLIGTTAGACSAGQFMSVRRQYMGMATCNASGATPKLSCSQAQRQRLCFMPGSRHGAAQV